MIASLVIVLMGVAWFGTSVYRRIPSSPEEALHSFYTSEAAEDQLMDPLILAGTEVVPLVTKELHNPEMPRKRYAIGALGNIGDRAALGVLDRVARNEKEMDYVRCDALAAMAMIDRSEGLKVLDTEQVNRLSCASEIREHVLRDFRDWIETNSLRRTYFEALLGWHG